MPFRILSRMALVILAIGCAAAKPPRASFQHPQRFAAGDTPTTAVIADFNHDGKPDLATTTSTGVSVLLNNGNGFALPVPYAAGGAALSLALAGVYSEPGGRAHNGVSLFAVTVADWYYPRGVIQS